VETSSLAEMYGRKRHDLRRARFGVLQPPVMGEIPTVNNTSTNRTALFFGRVDRDLSAVFQTT
jgi:hypothetical protein